MNAIKNSLFIFLISTVSVSSYGQENEQASIQAVPAVEELVPDETSRPAVEQPKTKVTAPSPAPVNPVPPQPKYLPSKQYFRGGIAGPGGCVVVPMNIDTSDFGVTTSPDGLVSAVVQSSSAQHAGLQPGDRIVSVERKVQPFVSDLDKMLGLRYEVILETIRQGKPMSRSFIQKGILPMTAPTPYQYPIQGQPLLPLPASPNPPATN